MIITQGDFFPELKGTDKTSLKDLKQILDEEEVSFAKTLDRGEKLFATYSEAAIKSGSKVLSGQDVWRLYDTYGFPTDLTKLMASEIGLGIDEAGREAAEKAAKEASKGGGKKDGAETVKLDVHDLGKLDSDDSISRTEDSAKFGTAPINSTIKAIYRASEFLPSTESFKAPSPTFGLILSETNFYAESGGQQGDHGSIVIDGQAEFLVTDTQVFSGYVLHIGILTQGQLKVGDEVVCTYDEVRSLSLFGFLMKSEQHLITFSSPPPFPSEPSLASPQEPYGDAYPQLWSEEAPR